MSITPDVRLTLEDAIAQRVTVFLSSSGTEYVFETRLLGIDETSLVVENHVLPRLITAFMRGDRFQLRVHRLRLESTSIASDGERLVFPLETCTALDETRQSERFPFAIEEQVVCEFINPHDGETLIRKTVMDMSGNGLSLRGASVSDLLKPGTFVKNLVVTIAGKPYTKADAQAVYQRRLYDLSGNLKMQIGLKFLNRGSSEASQP